jgi:hypothetical protein
MKYVGHAAPWRQHLLDRVEVELTRDIQAEIALIQLEHFGKVQVVGYVAERLKRVFQQLLAAVDAQTVAVSFKIFLNFTEIFSKIITVLEVLIYFLKNGY